MTTGHQLDGSRQQNLNRKFLIGVLFFVGGGIFFVYQVMALYGEHLRTLHVTP